MDYYLTAIFSLSIIIPAIIGCVRIFRINATYYPILICIFAACLSEYIGFVLAYYHLSNESIFNIYSYTEAILLMLQFRSWKSLTTNTTLVLLALYVLLFAGSFVILPWVLQLYQSVFNVLYCFIFVLLSISTLNRILARTEISALKHPVFLFCAALLIFNIYAILIEIFWLYGLTNDVAFASRVYDILSIINLIVNFIFTFAILCIPRKNRFILQSSSPSLS